MKGILKKIVIYENLLRESTKYWAAYWEALSEMKEVKLGILKDKKLKCFLSDFSKWKKVFLKHSSKFYVVINT